LANDEHHPQNAMSTEARSSVEEQARNDGTSDWTSLLARALTVRESWDHAAAELEESDAPSGPNDGPWSAWHVLNHVGGLAARAGEHLQAMTANGAVRQISPKEHWLGDEKSFAAVRSGAISGWDEFIGAITAATIAQAQEGSATHPAFGSFNPREFVALTLWHVGDHARQLRELRGLSEGENPGDSAGDLGRRRQTAH